MSNTFIERFWLLLVCMGSIFWEIHQMGDAGSTFEIAMHAITALVIAIVCFIWMKRGVP